MGSGRPGNPLNERQVNFRPDGRGGAGNPQRVAAAAAADEQHRRMVASDDDNECCVCLNAPKTHACIPCGHRCVCKDCASDLASKDPSLCPLCRTEVTEMADWSQ